MTRSNCSIAFRSPLGSIASPYLPRPSRSIDEIETIAVWESATGATNKPNLNGGRESPTTT
jgi:hypothetical protein